MNQEKRAVELVKSFQEKFGSSVSTAQFLSRFYLEQEEYEKAYEQLALLEGYEEENLNVKVKMALILIEQKKFPLAVEKLETILSLAPESDKIRFYLGAVYEQIKEEKLAIKHFRMIPSNSHYYVEAVVHTSYLLKGQLEMEEAQAVVKDAIERRSNVPEFYALYASLLDESKEYKVAINMLDAAVKKFPSHTQLKFFLGSMHDRVGDKQATIKAMREVVDLDADHVQALNFLAYTYAELSENLSEAETLARRALELSPNDGYVLDTVGWVLFKRGKLEESIRFLEAAFSTKKDESIVAEHLGDAYYRFELVEKAKKMYTRARKLTNDAAKKLQLKEKIVAITQQAKKREARTPASGTGK
jgi:tetratricopeptide (TPR) repeat protein